MEGVGKEWTELSVNSFPTVFLPLYHNSMAQIENFKLISRQEDLKQIPNVNKFICISAKTPVALS
ncbi:hypothetical protein GCM10028791_35970 [Echinicola sediminis]